MKREASGAELHPALGHLRSARRDENKIHVSGLSCVKLDPAIITKLLCLWSIMHTSAWERQPSLFLLQPVMCLLVAYAQHRCLLS